MRELEGRLQYINQSLEELLQRASSPLQRYSRHHPRLFFSLFGFLPYHLPFSRPIQINILIRQGYSGTSAFLILTAGQALSHLHEQPQKEDFAPKLLLREIMPI